MKKYCTLKGILALMIGLMIGLSCQSQKLESGMAVVYEPRYVPLLQGGYSHVGSIDMEGITADGKGKLSLSVDSDMEFDSLKLVARFGEKEVKNVGSVAKVKGKTTVEFETLPQGTKTLEIHLKANANHNLKDRVEIKLATLEIGQRRSELKSSKEVPAYRLAKALRSYGFDGVHSFRIPGMVTTPKGTLLAVYDIRRNSSVDLQEDIDVGLSRSTDGGRTWEPMKVIMDMGEWGGLPEDQNGIGDPAILVDHETGHIWVAALWLHGKPGKMAWNSSEQGMNPQETGQFMLVKSEDDGLTWSEPINITQQIKDPKWHLFFNGPGKGITMKDGTLVFPAQYKDANKMPHSTIIYSKDKGKTWLVGTGARSNTTEAQVVELADGTLMLNMRDNRGGSRSVAVTNDFGKTWTEHATSRVALVEPICMASIIDNPYIDQMLLFSNPTHEKRRVNMTIKASKDDGNSWPEELQLLLDEGQGWGYSCLTMINEKEVGILYESSGANITFQVVSLEDILKHK
jgi:sialidase-1